MKTYKNMSILLTLLAFYCLATASMADSVILTPASDTYASGWSADGGANANHDADAAAKVYNAGNKIGLMKFDVSALAGATINSAKLEVYVLTSGTVSDGYFTVYQPTTDWVATEASYNNPDNVANGWDGAGGNVTTAVGAALTGSELMGDSSAGTWVSWNFTDPNVIRSWADGLKASGVIIARMVGGAGVADYATLETSGSFAPKLTITYIPKLSGTGTVEFNPSTDAYVSGWSADGGANANHDADAAAKVYNAGNKIGLMKFDVSALDGATINSAKLEVYVLTSGTVSDGYFTVYQPTTDWVATEASYNNPDNVANGWDGAGGNVTTAVGAALTGSELMGDSAAGTWVSWSFTNPDAVRSWADGNEVSGVMIARMIGGAGVADYATLETVGDFAPKLTVGYTLPVLGPMNCSEVWQMGFGALADINKDCYVNLLDLGELAAEWLNCNDPNTLNNCTSNW